jgi:hypothetical protein
MNIGSVCLTGLTLQSLPGLMESRIPRKGEICLDITAPNQYYLGLSYIADYLLKIV